MIPNRLTFIFWSERMEKKRRPGQASPASRSLDLLFNIQPKEAPAGKADDARWRNVPERETRPGDAEGGSVEKAFAQTINEAVLGGTT
jgi:hypothetical protein